MSVGATTGPRRATGSYIPGDLFPGARSDTLTAYARHGLIPGDCSRELVPMPGRRSLTCARHSFNVIDNVLY